MRKPIRCDKGKVGYFRLRRKNMNNVKYVEEKNNRSIIIRRGCVRKKEYCLDSLSMHLLCSKLLLEVNINYYESNCRNMKESYIV